jgi:hypothetical protein
LFSGLFGGREHINAGKAKSRECIPRVESEMFALVGRWYTHETMIKSDMLSSVIRNWGWIAIRTVD